MDRNSADVLADVLIESRLPRGGVDRNTVHKGDTGMSAAAQVASRAEAWIGMYTDVALR